MYLCVIRRPIVVWDLRNVSTQRSVAEMGQKRSYSIEAAVAQFSLDRDTFRHVCTVN